METPVLLVWGEQDRSVPLAHGRHLAQELPNTHVLVDTDGGHMPRDPEAEVALNMAWLARGLVPSQASPADGETADGPS